MIFSKQRFSEASVDKDSFILNVNIGTRKQIIQIQTPCHHQCLKNTCWIL